MNPIQELNFEELLNLTIEKAHEAKKSHKTFRYLYALSVSIKKGQKGFPKVSHRMSLLEILCESLEIIIKQNKSLSSKDS